MTKLTNRQAIGVLDGLWSNPLFSEHHRQAFKIGIMAIKALEQDPCTDAVSRQAAIEAFQMFRGYEANRTNAEWVDRIETVLNQLPSVNPQPKTGHWILSDDGLYRPICNKCGAHPWKGYIPTVEEATKVFKYCPNCGAKMEVSE